MLNVKNTILLGTAHTGKSWAAAHFSGTTKRPLVVVIHNTVDPSYFENARGLLKDETLFVGVTSRQATLPLDFFHQQRKEYRNIWLSIYDLDPKQLKGFFESLTAAVKYSGNMLLVIDEAHLFISRRIAPPKLIGFFRGARRWGVDIMIVTHRYTDIHIDIRCIVNLALLFRVTESADLEHLGYEMPVEHLLQDIQVLSLGYHYFIFRDTGIVSGPTRL